MKKSPTFTNGTMADVEEILKTDKIKQVIYITESGQMIVFHIEDDKANAVKNLRKPKKSLLKN